MAKNNNDWGRSGEYDTSGRFGSNSLGRSVVGREKALLVSGLAMCLVFGIGGLWVLSNQPTVPTGPARVVEIEKSSQPEMIDVLVPVRDIEQDRQLDPEMFIRVSRARIGVSERAVRSYEEIRGKYSRALIPAQQPLIMDLVTDQRPINQVVTNIPPGFRAVTINVNATSGVEGWARAGAHVDVTWIADVSGERTARDLVENVKILSAERRTDANADPGAPVPTTVTLLVTDKDAQKVSLAATSGQLVLHLRGQGDNLAGNAGGALTIGGLMGRSSKADNGGVEGVAKVCGKNGVCEEFAVVGGKVMRKRE